MAANNSAHNDPPAVNSVGIRTPAAGAQRRLLTILEAATALSISGLSVRRLITGGHLPCVRFNRRLRGDTKDLESFVQLVTQPRVRVRGHHSHNPIQSSRKETERVEE